MDDTTEPLQAKEAAEASYWLTEAPVLKAILHMALPMILGMAAMSVYSFTDTLFVGMLDDTAALAAVTLCMPFCAIVIALSTGLEIGCGTFVARSIGAGELQPAKGASAFAMLTSVVLGVAVAAVAVAFTGPIVGALGAAGETVAPTSGYLVIYCLGAPFMLASMVGAQLLRCIARTREASIGIIVSAIANIALDPVLIFGCGLGVEGAALATVVANAGSCAYFLAIIARSELLSLNPWCIALRADQLADIAKIGLSGFLMGLVMCASSLVFNNVSMGYGAHVVAAFGISQCIVQLVELVAMGLYEGVVPLMGGAWGRGELGRLKEVAAKTALCILAACLVLCGAIVLGRAGIVGLFSSDAAVVEVGALILAAQAAAVAFEALGGLANGLFQACGKGLLANAMSASKGLLLVPCVLVGSWLFGVEGIAWSLLASACLWCGAGVALLATTKEGCRALSPAASLRANAASVE